MTPKKPEFKTLFDHLKQVTQYQDPDYFSKLTDADKKTWSTYMIMRYLSMNDEWTEIVNELQPLTTSVQLKPELVYRLLITIIPPSNTYLQYMKSQNLEKFDKELVETFMLFYSISEKEAIDYLHILYSKPDGIEEVSRILSMYGFDEKEIKKLTKIKK